MANACRSRCGCGTSRRSVLVSRRRPRRGEEERVVRAARELRAARRGGSARPSAPPPRRAGRRGPCRPCRCARARAPARSRRRRDRGRRPRRCAGRRSRRARRARGCAAAAALRLRARRAPCRRRRRGARRAAARPRRGASARVGDARRAERVAEEGAHSRELSRDRRRRELPAPRRRRAEVRRRTRRACGRRRRRAPCRASSSQPAELADVDAVGAPRLPRRAPASRESARRHVWRPRSPFDVSVAAASAGPCSVASMSHRDEGLGRARDGLHHLGLDVPRDRAGGRDDPAALRRRDALRRCRRCSCSASRRGGAASTFCVRGRELASCALIGALLPGANAVLFVAERHVPTGLASLIIGAVPLWVVVLRTVAGDRPPRAALAGVVVGFGGLVLLVRPSGGAPLWSLLLVVCSSVMWATGSFLSAPAADAARLVRRDVVRDARRRARSCCRSASRRRTRTSRQFSGRSIGGWFYLVTFGSVIGYTAYVVAARQRADRQGRDVRVREPGRGDRARRDRAARVAHVDDRGRRGRSCSRASRLVVRRESASKVKAVACRRDRVAATPRRPAAASTSPSPAAGRGARSSARCAARLRA